MVNARPWLILACSALGLSALLAVLLVLSRAPGVQNYFGLEPFFHTILVLHVNFAVLVWLLSFVGFVWVLHSSNNNSRFNLGVLGFSILGALLMLASPFVGDAQPIMSNYVPIIDSAPFFTGLTLFVVGISLLAWQVVIGRPWDLIRLSAVTWFVCLLVMMYHASELKQSEPTDYFEALFWGAGHVLQFVYVLVLWLVWKWSDAKISLFNQASMAVVLVAAMIFTLVFDPNGSASREAFTALMQWGMILILLPMLWYWLRQAKSSIDISITASALLMLLGLIIGLLIRDDTVIVTAHYHATNAAVTIAFMGLAYRLVSQFGNLVLPAKMITSQVILYTFGMVLYVLGMASSGWLGVPRKTAMTVDDSLERLSMGVMGLGGAISIVATLIFIAIMLYSFIRQQKLAKELK